MQRAIYWDIDGTLLDMIPSTPSRHASAVRCVIGDLPPVGTTAGQTDHQILSDMALSLGVEPSQRHEMVRLALDELDRITVNDLLSAPALLRPGCLAALSCVQDSGWENRIATGNSRVRAVAKLRSAGVLERFNLEASAFGDSAESRLELLFPVVNQVDSRSVVIGDTALDVLAARSWRLACVAVNGTEATRDMLRELGADLVVSDLEAGLDDIIAFLADRERP